MLFAILQPALRTLVCITGGGKFRAPAPFREQRQPIRSRERAHQVGSRPGVRG